MNTFLPEGYEAPRSGGYYMRLQQGENKLRILSKPIIGWEDWDASKNPVRYPMDKKPEKSLDPKKPMKHFWAMIVWNYQEEAIQILQINQAGVRRDIETLCNDADWGAPYFYDLKIIKTGEDMKTKYQVNPLPHKPLAEHIIQAFKDRPLYLEALFAGEDPFGDQWPNKTLLMVENGGKKEDVLVKTPIKSEDVISTVQATELHALLMTCDPTYKKSVFDSIGKAPLNVKDLKDLPTSYYEKIKQAAIRKRDEFNAQHNQKAFA